MFQPELTNEGKINEFMNGLIKYIQDREKKDKSSFEKLEEQAERELREQEEALKKTILDENPKIARELKVINDSIERCQERTTNKTYNASLKKRNAELLTKYTEKKSRVEAEIEQLILKKQDQLAQLAQLA